MDVFSDIRYCTTVNRDEDGWNPVVCFLDRYDVGFSEDASYVIHACGLDPNVTTPEDTDRRDARRKFLFCSEPRIMSWRSAVRPFLSSAICDPTSKLLWHHLLYLSASCPKAEKIPPSTSQRWQVVGDEYMDAIRAVESSVDWKPLGLLSMRCMLCRRCVEDTKFPIEPYLTSSSCEFSRSP